MNKRKKHTFGNIEKIDNTIKRLFDDSMDKIHDSENVLKEILGIY